MKIFLNISFWFWFFVFVEFVLVFGFCNFLIFLLSFILLKFECGGMLALCLWKSLLFLTHSIWAFPWVFCMCFTVIWIWFYFTFTDVYYWSLFWDPLLYCHVFCENRLFDFYRSSTDCFPHNTGSRCGESWKRFLFFFCLPLNYVYVAHLPVFFDFAP